jgi:hypothetical protein
MRRFKKFFTPSRTSPKGGRRACLCKDNTYSIKCCDGSLRAQGIGRITGLQTPVPSGSYGYKIQRCGHSQQKHVWNGQELTIGNVYYFDLVHDGHDGCYTVLSRDDETSGFEWESVTPYNNCTDCEDAN